MKIHTTQNLSSIAELNSTNIKVAQKELSTNPIKHDSSFYDYHSNTLNLAAMSFKGKKPDTSKISKKIIEAAKKLANGMKEKAAPEVRKEDIILKSPLFNWALKVVQNEAVAQSSVAAVACAARAGTLWAMADENNKKNNSYAIAHALASGIVGFITVFLLTTPFKAGADHVMKKMYTNLSEKTLKWLHPHLDEKSLINSLGKRETDMKKWKNIHDKLPFDKEIKVCDMLPKAKQLADMSIETFEKYLGVKNIDWAAQKGKSFNEIVSKDGKKLYDLIDFQKLAIEVSHNEVSSTTGKKVATSGQILLQDINENYLKELIEKADENSILKNLDIKSVFKDGKVQDFRTWKEIGSGKNFKLDLDRIKAVSPLETADYSLRITGEMRFDAEEGIHKFITRQCNGADPLKPTDIRGLGSKIDAEMINSDKGSAGLLKSLVWAPDIVFRIPVALTTVSLIPTILKNVFNLEKNKKPAVNAAENKNINDKPIETKVQESKVAFKGRKSNETQNNNISFKAGKDAAAKGFFDKMMEVIGEFMAKLYGKPLIESKAVQNLSEKLAKVPGGLTQAMSVFGSLLTSSAYIYGTLTNKKLEKENKNTLAINQLGCFVVPTILGYTVDRIINNWVKKKEYRFSGLAQAEAAKHLLEGNAEKSKAVMSDLKTKVKGFRSLASVTVFALIYRYFTPVAITPIANRIGDKYNAKQREKQQLQNAKVA